MLVKGRLFWLRSIGSSCIGEAVFTGIAFGVYFAGKTDASNVITIIVSTYSIKVIYAVVLAGPANLLANILKRIEKSNPFNEGVSFNPFKLN